MSEDQDTENEARRSASAGSVERVIRAIRCGFSDILQINGTTLGHAAHRLMFDLMRGEFSLPELRMEGDWCHLMVPDEHDLWWWAGTYPSLEAAKEHMQDGSVIILPNANEQQPERSAPDA